MRIIYRMRGLLGDATEEFIETLENKENEDQDDEEVYKLANVMADCNGLEVMLGRLESIQDTAYSKQLLTVLLKLFGYCIKVKKNRENLLNPNLKAIPILLQCLKLCLSSGETARSATSGPSVSEVILQHMECLLVEAASKDATIEKYIAFASSGVTKEDIDDLLNHAVHLKAGTALHQVFKRGIFFIIM